MQNIQLFSSDFKQKYQQDISTIPSDLHYVLVFPYHCFLKTEQQYKQVYPVILTFRDDTQTIQKLIDKFLKLQTQGSQFKNCSFEFTLSRGHVLQRQMTFRQMKINLRNKNLDGIHIYITKHGDIDSMSDPQLYHQDQCCVTTYLFDDLKGDSNDDLAIKVKVPSKNNQFLYFTIPPKKNVQVLRQKFIAKVKQVYGQSLQEKDLLKFTNSNGDIEQNIACQNIQKSFELDIEACLANNIMLQRVINKSKTLTIHGQHLKQPVKLIYDEHRYKQFQLIYKQLLKPDYENDSKSSEYSLKVMDKIIKPNEQLSEIAIFFDAKNDPNQKYNLVARIIHQKIIFYDKIYKLTEDKPFNFENVNLKISEEQRSKIDSKISQMASKTKQEYFKDKKNLEPIFLYTSSIKYEDPNNNQDHLLYNGINNFLRGQEFSKANKADLLRWQYLYTSHLLNKLKKLQDMQINQNNQWIVVWRGITYDILIDPKGSNPKLLLKSFNSASKKKSVAQGFANKGNGIHSIWKMKIKAGKDIKFFSKYSSEDQILILPYTQFKVTNRQQQGKYIIYEMEEIEFKKNIPKTTANFILWVDDKLGEGKKIFQKVNCDTETTILVQLLSTDQLQKWLVKHDNIINDQSANIIFITNMTRKQKIGDEIVSNGTAGIDGIKKLRDRYPEIQIPVFVYIGNLQLSREKLINGGIDISTVKLSKFSKDIISFIVANCKDVEKKEQLYKTAPNTNQSDQNNPQSYPSMKKSAQSQMIK